MNSSFFVVSSLLIFLWMSCGNPLDDEGCDLYVTQEGGSDSPACGVTQLLACASIQQAVNNAPEGATVCVKASPVPYGCLNATQEGGVSIARSMKVKAIEGRAIIDCQFGGRAFTISSATSHAVNVTLMGLDMRNGFAWGSEGGGGMVSASGPLVETLSIVDCVFVNNSNPQGCGGAISVVNATMLSVENSTFCGNEALDGGALCSLDGEKLRITNTQFIENAATQGGAGGGAICSSGTGGLVLIEGCTFANNAAPHGGALASCDDRLLLRNSTFVDNLATQFNGGAASFSRGTPRIVGTTFVGNAAQNNPGGALYLEYGGGLGSSVEGCSFVNNSARLGGAIATYKNNGSQVVSDCTFIDNASIGSQGGALSSYGDAGLSVSRCAFLRNTVTDGGSAGGLFSDGTIDVAITATAFVSNTADKAAGAAWVFGAARFTCAAGSAFTKNIARGGGGGGILIESCRSAILSSCHFEGNGAANGFGGALNFFNITSSSLTGCRFVDNEAEQGGGIFSEGVLDGHIAHNIFANNTAAQLGGGCLLIDSRNDSVAVLKNNTVTSNSAALGGGMSFWFWSNETYQASHNISHHFIGGSFVNNSATMGSGGAVSVVSSPDAPLPSTRTDPTQIEERAWIYTGNHNTFSGVAFLGNTANCSRCTGGALYLNGGETFLRGCRFEQNQANVHGGAISVGGSSTQLGVSDSFFSSNQATMGGDVFSFAGGALVFNSSSFSVTNGGTQPFFAVPEGGTHISFMNASVNCPMGNAFVNDTPPSFEAEIPPWGLVIVNSVALQCSPCPSGQYSLQAGALRDDVPTNITCLDCPDYANCSLGGAQVFALPGYWCGSFGEEEEEEIACLVCPLGYCQSETLFPWDETCIGYRTGILCGECQEGYSEAWGTSECVPEEECGFSQSSWWLLLLALAFGLIYVVLLVWIPVGDHPLWKSLLYFMQIGALVVTANGQELVGGDATAHGILNGVLTFFALDPNVLGLHVGLCPWSGLTAVQKMASGYLLPVTLFVELALIGGGHLLWSLWWFRWRKTRNERGSMLRGLSENGEEEEEVKDLHLQDMRVVVATRPTLLTREKSVVGQEEEEGDYPDDDISAATPTTTSENSSSLRRALLARYGAGIMALMLVTYESFTSVTMDLLHCVRSVVDDSLVLFRAGTESCFSWWQIGLLVFLGTVLVPFPISLALLRWLIRSRTWLQHSTLGKAILMVLEKPYARHYKWWESWSMFRRLALIALATFVLDPLGRAVALFGGCLFALLMHLGANPYNDRRHNRVETIFLSDLVLIAALDIPQATTQHLGSSLDDDTLSVFGYIQSVLLLLPLAYSFLVVSLMLGNSLIRATIFRRNRDHMPSSDTAAYNLYTEDDERKTATTSALVTVMRWIAVQLFLLEWTDDNR